MASIFSETFLFCPNPMVLVGLPIITPFLWAQRGGGSQAWPITDRFVLSLLRYNVNTMKSRTCSMDFYLHSPATENIPCIAEESLGILEYLYFKSTNQIQLLAYLKPRTKPQVLTWPMAWACSASVHLSDLLATLSSARSDSALGAHHVPLCSGPLHMLAT